MSLLENRVKLIKLESERLGRYLNGLSPYALCLPSACEGWTVGDVAAHLVWFAEFCLDVISRGIEGDTSPLEGFPPAGTASDEWINEHFAQSAIARRQSLGDQLLPTFDVRYEQLCSLMARLDAQDWEKSCYHERGNRPVHGFPMGMVNELAIHGWDIRSSLEPAAPLSSELLPLLMERIQQLFRDPRPADFLASSTLPSRLRYRFDVTGAVPLKQDMVIEDGKCWMEPVVSEEADATFRCNTQAFVLLMNRRLSLDAVSVSA